MVLDDIAAFVLIFFGNSKMREQQLRNKFTEENRLYNQATTSE